MSIRTGGSAAPVQSSGRRPGAPRDATAPARRPTRATLNTPATASPTPSADVPDASTAVAIHTQQIRLLYENLRAGLWLSGSALIMVLVAVRMMGPLPRSVFWWGSLTLAWIGMGFLLHAIYRRQATDATLHGWAVRAAVGSAIAGVFWGGIGFCLLDPEARPLAPLFIAVVCLVALGVYAAYACYLPAMYGFVLGVTLTFSVAMVVVADRMHLVIAAFLIMTAVLALVSGRNFNRLLSSEIITRTRNDRLLRELTAKQAEVESANLAKTRFLAAASHDLRQPVHAINLYGEVLREHVPAGVGRQALGSMAKSIQALDGLFESIEDIAKFEAGIVTPKVTAFNLEQVFEALRANHTQAARAKGLTLSLPQCDLRVRSDEALLRRILGNLVSNAIRYTDAGRIEVGVTQRESELAIAVRDTGIGIAQDKLDDIFREYVQLHNPERDRAAGLGLGLNIVKRLADLLDHRLSVWSRLGEGSVFTLVVPLAAEDASATPAPVAGDDTDRLLSGAFIAVIDDEQEVLDATGLLLRGWRCHVLTASSGDEAMALLQREQRFPDLILSDYRLRNDESGIQVVARVRALLDHPVPALLISGDIDPARVKEAHDHGLPLLHKPLRVPQLRAAMAQQLRTRVL